jgi:hypothetical protein
MNGPDSRPDTGPSPTDVGFTRHRILKRASRLQPTCDGPRFARAPQGDGQRAALADLSARSKKRARARAAAIIATTPISPQVTPRGVALSVDQAQAITYVRYRRAARHAYHGYYGYYGSQPIGGGGGQWYPW